MGTEEPELTEDERRRLRAMLEQDERLSWLRSTLRAWALAIAAVVTGVTLGLDAIKAIARKLVE